MSHLHVVYDQAQPGFRVLPQLGDASVDALQVETLDEVIAIAQTTHLGVYTEYPGLWLQLQQRGVTLVNADPLERCP